MKAGAGLCWQLKQAKKRELDVRVFKSHIETGYNFQEIYI